MNILYILAIAYPVYRTSECIRKWNKVKKVHFQNLCVLWYTFFFVVVFRDAFSWLMSYLCILSLYDLFALLCIICNYTPKSSHYVRSFVVLPLLKEMRKWGNPLLLEVYNVFLHLFGRGNISKIWNLRSLNNENIFT